MDTPGTTDVNRSSTRRIVLDNNQFRELHGDEDADYELLSPNQSFSGNINLIPITNAVQSVRPFYGARFFNQALPLSEPEAPRVQSLIDGDEQGRTFDQVMGDRAGNIRADAAGTIRKIDKNRIVLQTDEGEDKEYDLYDLFPLNRKTGYTNIPRVEEGDRVEPGRLLARSNFTTDDGSLGMGTNARVAVVPFRGYSMDDATVISEGFAQRLSSDHMLTNTLKLDPTIRTGRDHFTSLFPRAYTQKQLQHLDEDGIAKPGEIIQPEDPLILATKPKVISSVTTPLGGLSRSMREVRNDASVTWDYDEPGEITDVSRTKDGIKVNVRSFMPAREGDKITQRGGNKATISRIVSDKEMPRGRDGKPMDLLFNQLGLPSRVNASTLYEMLLGRVARERGETVKVPSFNPSETPWYEIVQDHLEEAGVDPYEKLYDPQLDRELDNPVLVGDVYVQKLHHQARGKLSARGMGSYDQDEQPATGGTEWAQAKRLSGLERDALRASGAYDVLREGATLKGARNYNYWRDIRAGRSPKKPGPPFVWDKFLALLQGAGLNPQERIHGRKRLGPMTNEAIDELHPKEVTYPGTIDVSTLQPISGGLFDESLLAGDRWGKITLPFPVPNPGFEESIRKVLGLTKKQLRNIMSGSEELPEHLR